MSDIYKMFVFIQMMLIGMWIHHHSATVKFAGVDFGKSAEMLDICRTDSILSCGGWGFRSTQSGCHIHIRQVFAIIQMMWIGKWIHHRWLLLSLQCPPPLCRLSVGSHTCGWSAHHSYHTLLWCESTTILHSAYGIYQGPLATGHSLVGLSPSPHPKRDICFGDTWCQHDVTQECPWGVTKMTTQNLASHAIVYLT